MHDETATSGNGDVLVLKDVVKNYGTFRAVDDLSFRVPRGCIYGFLGPNGAGKTTTLRMVLDILKPSGGSISILGSPSAMAVISRLAELGAALMLSARACAMSDADAPGAILTPPPAGSVGTPVPSLWMSIHHPNVLPPAGPVPTTV